MAASEGACVCVFVSANAANVSELDFLANLCFTPQHFQGFCWSNAFLLLRSSAQNLVARLNTQTDARAKASKART